ncbi:MAG: SigE family polymerase sigma factor [Frankiales bacterium]|nr:SigE family polymerase sigma factor [Frankiales bacterium]
MADLLLPPRQRQALPGDSVPGTDIPSSFDAFYTATAPRLVRQLHAMTGDLSEAQDCVQEAYARAWQRWTQVSSYAAPEAWVRQVAWRLAVSRFRRARVGAGVLRRHGGPDDVPALSGDRVALVTALRQLPAAQRSAVVLHHLVGLSVAEVAMETGAPEGTVKARLSRGRTALAALLRDTDTTRPDTDTDTDRGAPRG